MKLVAVCRGRPGLGRVVPSLGLVQTLNSMRTVDPLFVTYSVGYRYLQGLGENVVDLGEPSGLFIDSVSPQAIEIERLVATLDPEVVLIDGEFFLPVALAHIGAPVVYLANPHDLVGQSNIFRRVNRLLLQYCRAVIISALSCPVARYSDNLVPGVPCLEVPPIIKVFPPVHRHCGEPPRVLVNLGGGSVGASPGFREQTQHALVATITALSEMVARGEVSQATVVLGADATYPSDGSRQWLTVLRGPLELTRLYADHDVFVTRAGRNACAEAQYCGIATVLLPVTADPLRASEQTSNAESAGRLSNIFSAFDWQNAVMLSAALSAAVAYASSTPPVPGVRGNDDAAVFLTRLAEVREHDDYKNYP